MKKRKFLSAVLTLSILCSAMVPVAWANDASVQAVESVNTQGVSEEPTVTGGQSGVDYEWQGDILVIRTDTPLTISGNFSRYVKRINVQDDITANLKLVDAIFEDRDDFYLGQNAIANIECENSTISAIGSLGSILKLNYAGGYNNIVELYSDGNILFDGPTEDPNDWQQIGMGLGKLKAKCLTINGGSYDIAGGINTDELTINNGFFQLSEWIYVKKLMIHGGRFLKISNVDSMFQADEYVIDGGTFVDDCDIANNLVWGYSVSEGKVLTYDKRLNDVETEYTVIDESEVLNHYDVAGDKADYTYNGRKLTLYDGADVTVSSNGTVCDQIVIEGNYENPAYVNLTLDGVIFEGPMSGIVVQEGCSLTLNLKAGSNNYFEIIQEHSPAIQIKNDDSMMKSSLKICGTGSLNAKAKGFAAAIGTDTETQNVQINIESGNIEAYTYRSAAAIGGAKGSSYVEVNISGGNIKASSDFEGTGIGGGNNPEINISGGTIEARGVEGAAIGTGWGGSGAEILITGGNITAKAGGIGGAAIGGSDNSIVGKIDISGKETRINATANYTAAIGSGAGGYVDEINISGGHIIAKAGDGSAAIGGSSRISSVGTIDITGGTIEAYGGAGAYGIGAGKGGIGGKFSTGDGNPVIITNSISDQNSESVWNGVFIVDSMNGGVGKIYGNKVTPTNDFTIPAGKTLEVDADQSLIIAKGITATNNGTVIRDKNGVVDVRGKWLGNPVIVKGEEEGSAVTGVTLNKRTLALKPGENEILTATVSPATAANKSLRWTSSNTDVATIDANGKVNAVANGMAVITVSTVDGGFTAQCTVTVSEKQTEVVAVENVKLNKTSLTLDIGESESLKATVTPEEAANKNVTWSSNDEDVASVDAKGKVTAISRGTATITVRTEDGNFAAQCKVTVTDPNATTTDTETQPDGSTVTTVEDVNGSSSSTIVDVNGVVNTSVTLSDSAVSDAAKNDTAVILPMVGVKASKDMASAPSVTVDLPGNTPVQVEIPVLDMTPGTVAVLVDKNGSKTILKNSVLGNNGLIVTLSDGETVKILDNTQTFSDVDSSHWAKNNIDYVTSRGLFVGTSASEFAPETPMSRAMIVSVLQRYEGDDTAASPGEDWYEGARQWAMEAGISDGSDMMGNVTREQLVTMLYRYIGSPQMIGGLNSYSDVSSVSSYAEQAMVWAVRNGIIGGMTADTLAPQGMATRAQVAAILQRFIAWEQTA